MTYGATHMALRRRGLASAYPCIRCGKPAEQWALQHDRPGVVVLHEPKGPFSERVEDYEPMCTSCHRLYDYGGLCGAGLHQMTGENIRSNGAGRRLCRACVNARKRRDYVPKGFERSPETRQKLREAATGHVPTAEQRANMSAAQKRRRDRERQENES